MQRADDNPESVYETTKSVPPLLNKTSTLKEPPPYSISSTTTPTTKPAPLQNGNSNAESTPTPAVPKEVAMWPPGQQQSMNGGSNASTTNLPISSIQTPHIGSKSHTKLYSHQRNHASSNPPSASSPPVDLGTQLTGVASRLLGLTIQKQSSSGEDGEKVNGSGLADTQRATTTSKNTKKVPKEVAKPPKYECVVHALGDIAESVNGEQGNGATTLDMYTYHRGREGMEARDKTSGDLLCVEEVTDTNHELDAPKLTFSVKVEFPLDDPDDDDDQDANNPKRMLYTDVLDWDLSDPSTPSPLDFANSVAREYGLSFGATLDLAASIEQQIETHLAAQYHFSEPVALKDPQGLLERDRQAGPIMQAHRYDQVMEAGRGGFLRPKRARQAAKTRSTGNLSGRSSNKTTSNVSDTDSIAADTGQSSSAERRRSSLEAVPAAKESYATRDEDEIEDVFVEEVKKRARKASVLDIIHRCENGVVGQLEEAKNVHCHICHKRTDIGFIFPCGRNNHIYCLYHINVSTQSPSLKIECLLCRLTLLRVLVFSQTRLGITVNFVCESCPICCLSCECAKCSRRLNSVAKIFKARSLDQNKSPAETEFPEILDISTKKQQNIVKNMSKAASAAIRERKVEHLQNQLLTGATSFKEKRPNGVKMRTCQKQDEMMVPKPPLADFPTEIFNGQDLEPASLQDYFTVFSADGHRIVNDLPDTWLEEAQTFEPDLTIPPKEASPAKEAELGDDGSVDYCHFCMKPGNIICCDYCPRAFHEKCMNENGYHDQSISDDDAKWECVICRNEKGGLEDDFIDGKSSMDQVFSSFITVDTSHEVLGGMEVLSIVHEMVLKLMKYDFGYMFSEPVDLASVPGYALIVKQPMDLGTICRNIINGEYSKLLNDGNTIDDVVVRVLKDIELVWHNCLTYNFEGSAVCRMAQVLRRRASMIRKRSFNHKLSVKVKYELEEFVRDTENARAAMSKGTTPGAAPSASFDEVKKQCIIRRKPSSTHKIFTQFWNPKISKPVAVLDPVSGRVVRAYGTSKSAAEAVQVLLDAGHRCEWNAKSGLNMKLVAEKSGSDPTMLLFGYRWVFLDDLRNRRVAFLKPDRDLVEMRLDNCTFVFQSVEEALSFPEIPKETNLGALRELLNHRQSIKEWKPYAGLLWRRPEIQPTRQYDYIDDNKQSDLIEVNAASRAECPDEIGKWQQCAIVKRDLISKRNLVGFDSISTAHKDWIHTVLASPMLSQSEDQSLDYFRKYYLDADRNIDGIVWWSNPNGGREVSDEDGRHLRIDSTVLVDASGQGVEPSTESSRKRKRKDDVEAFPASSCESQAGGAVGGGQDSKPDLAQGSPIC